MNQTLPRFLLVLSLPLSFFYAGCKKEAPLQHALDSFQLEEGLRIELVAAEPMIVDPVALAFDEYQRMYVVENRGYPDPA